MDQGQAGDVAGLLHCPACSERIDQIERQAKDGRADARYAIGQFLRDMPETKNHRD